MVMNYGHGPTPLVRDVRDEPGEVLTPADVDAPSLTPQQIAQFAKQFANEAQSYYYPTWRTCTNLISGWRMAPGVATQATPQTAGLAQWMRPRDASINLIQPLFRNVVARLSVEQPAVVVIPATESPDDITKARASELALRYHWRQAKIKQVLTELIEWLALHGTAGLHTYMMGSAVCEQAIAPDRLRAEPGVGNPDDSRFLGFTVITTRDALKAQFPDKTKEINEAPTPSTPFVPSNSPFGATLPPDRVEVLQAYCRSGHWFLLVGEGGTVLAQGKTPGKCMPLQIVRYTKIPGQFFGMGMVEPNMDVQYSFSTVFNQILRNARLMSNPKVLIERGAKVDENAFTAREGEKVFYSGTKPDVWVPPPLPAYMQQLPAMLQSYSHDVTGIHTTSTGKRAVGISSGRAIEALTANDLAQLQSTQDSIIFAVEAMSTCYLLFAQAYYPEDKYIREYDRSGKAMFSAIKPTDFVENPEVFIQASSLFTADVQDRDQKTLDLLRLGLIDAKTARKMLSFHLDPTAPIEEIADLQHAQEALMAVATNGYFVMGPDGMPMVNPLTGQPRRMVDVRATDNLEMFQEVVGSFMRTPEFHALPADKQDAVDALYADVLRLVAAAQAPMDGKPELNSNGNPKGMNPPGTPDQPVGGMLPGGTDQTLPQDAAVDAAEAGVL